MEEDKLDKAQNRDAIASIQVGAGKLSFIICWTGS